MKQTKLSVHPLAYLEGRATTILNFHNNYYCGKQSGIEIIRCGKRLATNGDISLSLLPKDTDNRPKLKQRHVSNSSELRTELFSEEMHQDYQVNLVAKEDGLHLHLSFSQVPPKKYSGQLSFQLHLFPVFYWGKGFQSENDFGIFPRQFTRSKNNISPENGEILAQGRRLNLAPEEKQLAFGVESQSGTLDLIDASEIGISGCFVIREVLQLDSENPQIHWKINLPELEDYVEEKQIQYSQVGYHPAQKKWAVIECDLQDSEIPSVTLSKLSEEGIFKSVKAEKAKSWGPFLNKNFFCFDFSSITEEGLYQLTLPTSQSNVFSIANDVYQRQVWQPVLGTFIPVQMCHVEVRDRGRVWHGLCHTDDALQAPLKHPHFDGYSQGSATDSPFQPGDALPHLDKGGWHDAGDFDLSGTSQSKTTYFLALAAEEFKPDFDQSSVDWEKALVLLHKPNGVPDIEEQVMTGVWQLLGAWRACGHAIEGVIESTFQQYIHLGDASTMTINKTKPSNEPMVSDEEIQKKNSNSISKNVAPKELTIPGHELVESPKYTRWAFTSTKTNTEYLAITALASASRVLRSSQPEIAKECLQAAEDCYTKEITRSGPIQCKNAIGFSALCELMLSSSDLKYRDTLKALAAELPELASNRLWQAARAAESLQDAEFTEALKPCLQKYSDELSQKITENPYALPWSSATWGIGWKLQEYGLGMYYLCRLHPQLFSRELLLSVLDYVLGKHPGRSVSLVSGVGSDSFLPAYGTNRADFGHIPGGVISGPAHIEPNRVELLEGYPFLWQQSEYVIHGAATFVFCAMAADSLLNQ